MTLPSPGVGKMENEPEADPDPGRKEARRDGFGYTHLPKRPGNKRFTFWDLY